jgi:hypothetical protein
VLLYSSRFSRCSGSGETWSGSWLTGALPPPPPTLGEPAVLEALARSGRVNSPMQPKSQLETRTNTEGPRIWWGRILG